MPLYNMTRQEMMYAVAGGAIAGLASSLLFLLFGRFIGTSSIIQGVLHLKLDSLMAKKITILAAIIFSSALLKELYHEHSIGVWFFDNKQFFEDLNPSILIMSGMLSGIGSILGGGGLFGHGLCGVPRFSGRSIFATILMAIAAVYTNKEKFASIIIKNTEGKIDFQLPNNIKTDYYILGCLLIPFICFIFSKKKSVRILIEFTLLFFIGAITGLGLMIGGMTQLSDYLHIFNYNKYWDPTILVFCLTVVLINMFSFNYLIYSKKPPLFQPTITLPQEKFDIGLIIGPILFGVGWGLTGITPGSWLLLLPLKNTKIAIFWGLSFVVGVKIAEILQSLSSRMTGKVSKK